MWPEVVNARVRSGKSGKLWYFQRDWGRRMWKGKVSYKLLDNNEEKNKAMMDRKQK